MAPTSKLSLLLVTLTALFPAAPCLGAGFGVGAGAIDITKNFANLPEFSTFSSMLNETDIALAINSCNKVTVLAPNNTAIAAEFGGMARVPRSLLADLLALHVVLGYIDEPKLAALKRGRKGEGSVVTTLLQVLRAPPRGMGFLRVYSGDGGRPTFSSFPPAGRQNATVERQVAAQPNSVVVLQVSGFVVPPDIRVPRVFPPRASRHIATPPGHAPAPGPHAPLFGSGPLLTPPIFGTGPLLPPPMLAPSPVKARAPGPAHARSHGSGSPAPSPVKPAPGPHAHAPFYRSGRPAPSPVKPAPGPHRHTPSYGSGRLAPSPIKPAPGPHVHAPSYGSGAPAPSPTKPVPAPGPHTHAPSYRSGPPAPSPTKPVPAPHHKDTPAPVPPKAGDTPSPSVDGGAPAEAPSAAGRSAVSWWSGVAVALGITICLHLHL